MGSFQLRVNSQVNGAVVTEVRWVRGYDAAASKGFELSIMEKCPHCGKNAHMSMEQRKQECFELGAPLHGASVTLMEDGGRVVCEWVGGYAQNQKPIVAGRVRGTTQAALAEVVPILGRMSTAKVNVAAVAQEA